MVGVETLKVRGVVDDVEVWRRSFAPWPCLELELPMVGNGYKGCLSGKLMS